MNGAVWLALGVGAALGALAALLWRARREQALVLESGLLRARLKNEETVSAEREQALARAREQLPWRGPTEVVPTGIARPRPIPTVRVQPVEHAVQEI